MANITLKEIQKNFGRKHLKTASPEGPILAELQDYVEDLTQVIPVPLSFETGEQGIVKVYLPFRATVKRVRLQVVKALAATDAGTVQMKDSAGTNMANGLATLAASSAYGTEATITPTTLNLVVEDGFFSMTTAKTTAGGKLIALVEVYPTPVLT